MKMTIYIVLLLPLVVIAQPYEPTVIWDRIGETDSSAYGYKILPLGDQNDDGFADWAVYAQGNGGGWHGTRASYLEFFHGDSQLSTEPYMTYRATSGQMWQAYPTSDVNGDEYEDWWAAGELFFGGPQADTIPDMMFAPSGGFVEGTIGDFNGDGYSDLYTYNFQNQVLRIYYGGSPIDTLVDWVLGELPPGLNNTLPYAKSDFNGDGASDFLCYNPNPPYNTAIFLGGSNPDTLADYFWSNMTQPLGGVRSLNGDNADELLFSALDAANVHFGGDALSSTPNTSLNSGAAGYAVSAGDFNNDTYHDLILFSPTTSENMFGALTLHLGHPWLYPNPAFIIEGWSEPLNLIGIWTATGLGDINGDSIDDIAVGAWDDFAYLGWRGRCVILSGDDTLIADADDARPEIPHEIAVNVYPNPFNSSTTVELTLPAHMNEADLQVFNLLGQQVFKSTLEVAGNEITYHYNANDLSTGVYLLRVSADDLSTTTKLMILK